MSHFPHYLLSATLKQQDTYLFVCLFIYGNLYCHLFVHCDSRWLTRIFGPTLVVAPGFVFSFLDLRDVSLVPSQEAHKPLLSDKRIKQLLKKVGSHTVPRIRQLGQKYPLTFPDNLLMNEKASDDPHITVDE